MTNEKMLDALALAEFALLELSDRCDGDDPIFDEGGVGYRAFTAIRDIFQAQWIAPPSPGP